MKRYPLTDLIGPVSEATTRHEDTLPQMLYLAWEMEKRGVDFGEETKLLYEVEERMGQDGYYDTDDVEYDWDEVFDVLNDYAPPYCYFGTLEGDGACLGLWADVEAVNGEVERGDELPEEVSDSGYFAVISDHGNMDLYEWDEGEWKFVWGVV